MINIHQQNDPHCQGRHHYDPDCGDLLHELQHNEYKDIEKHVNHLFELAKSKNSSTKEILAYHLTGNCDYFNKRYNSAMKNLEYAIKLARKKKNKLAIAVIGFDLIRVCTAKHKYNVVFETLNEIIMIYKGMDLIDEKIHCLIQLSTYYQAYRSINLAKILHDTLEECDHHKNNCVHHFYIKLSLAHLTKKSRNYKKTLEMTKCLLSSLEKNSHANICESNIDYLQTECYLLMAECYFELKQREKSIANLDSLRKITQKIQNSALTTQYKLIRMEHEILFENCQLDTKKFIEIMNFLYNHGQIEFCLEQHLRLLNKLNHDNVLNDNEDMINVYQGFLHKLTRHMPHNLIPGFNQSYEFKPGQSLKSSSEYQMKKFIEMGHELLCEHNLHDLAQKILHFISTLSNMERGFVTLFDTMFSETVTATNHFNNDELNDEKHPDYSCQLFSEAVLEHGRPFIQSTHISNDLFHLSENQQTLLQSINKPSIIVLPLVVSGENMGIIYLDSKSKNVIKKEEDITLLESLVSLVANIIHNASHLERKTNSKKRSCNHLYDIEAEIANYSYDSFIGISESKKNLINMIKHTLNNTATVTLSGNSGVGKEMVAKMIHYNSPRKHKPFITVNCAAIPEALLETELFGHTKGAFTDAKDNKSGLFVTANGGTIFLDKIGEMPLSMQVKILRALQEREITAVGATSSQKIDVRIICATNRNLEKMVKEANFREDLYYRISVIKIHVDSLSNRKEDIPLLVDFALKQYADENNVPQKTVSNQAMSFLINYPWPGNVRELFNVMYNLSIFVDKPCIELSHLEERKELFRMPIDTHEQLATNPQFGVLTKKIDSQQISLSEAKQEFEKLQIERALKLFNGQITSASYHLQMPRPQVSRLMKKYKLTKQEFKEEDSDKST